jgi:monoamine oxidase
MKCISRRTFLATAAGFAATPVLGAPAPAEDVDVVIVGAGAAGIAAARRVAASGRSFVVLEAAARVGGRCYTDAATFGVPYDRGAQWIRLPDTNPIAKLAPQVGLEIYLAPPGRRIRIGRRNARESEMEEFLIALVRANRAIRDAGEAKTDVACAAALPKDLGDWRQTIDFVLGPYRTSKDLSTVSVKDFARSPEFTTDAFCRQGLGTLMTRLAGKIPVRLSTPVSKITWGGRGGVEVETARGTIKARAVILTASTNVLAGGGITFDPELPARPREALGQLALGTFERIALEMPGNPLGLERDELVYEKCESRRTAAIFANPAGRPVCLVDVAGRFGRDLAAQGKPAMIDFATEWLAGFYGSEIKTTIRRSDATQWDRDPLVRGAMSVAAPGHHVARRVLMEPLRDRIWFAGEAAHETLWGTVGGAWESGERAAAAAVTSLTAQPAPSKAKSKPKSRSRSRSRSRRQRR